MLFKYKDNKVIRLDIAILNNQKTLNRSYIKKLISTDRVKVNNIVINKAGFNVHFNDEIMVDLKSLNLKDISIPIIYQDDHIMVINKPVGILSHSKGQILDENTVSSWLSSQGVKMTGNRAGIVHRLDRATSGVMVLAKDIESQKYLQKQFSLRKVKKVYYAVVNGIPNQPEAIIEIPIKRNRSNPKSFIPSNDGKPACTQYKVVNINHNLNLTLLKLMPTTGRTHQLRVHLNYLDLPIVGDSLYNEKNTIKSTRMYLHAASLEITLPVSRVRKVFETNLPEEFNQIMSDTK